MNIVTIKNNSDEDIAFRLYLVNMQMTLKPDNAIILSIKTSEETEYYENLDIEGLEVTVDGEPNIPQIVLPATISSFLTIEGIDFINTLRAEVEKVIESGDEEQKIVVKQNNLNLICSVLVEAENVISFYELNNYDNMLFGIEINDEAEVSILYGLSEDMKTQLNYEFYNLNIPINPIPNSYFISDDNELATELANNIDYMEELDVWQNMTVTQVNNNVANYVGFAQWYESGSANIKSIRFATDDEQDEMIINIEYGGATPQITLGGYTGMADIEMEQPVE